MGCFNICLLLSVQLLTFIPSSLRSLTLVLWKVTQLTKVKMCSERPCQSMKQVLRDLAKGDSSDGEVKQGFSEASSFGE